MVAGETKTFDIVRRGYDTDQVDQFLRVQADAWAGELEETRRANTELEERVAGLLEVETENERLRRGEADFNERKAAASRIQEESLAASRAEIDEQRRLADEETTRMRAEAEAEVTEKLKQAEDATADADRKARAAAEAVLKEHQGVLDTMQADFDARFTRTKTQYERVLHALEAKVDELRETHAGLVSGLEAIARGGLAATTLDDLEPLEEFDTGQPGTESSSNDSAADDTAEVPLGEVPGDEVVADAEVAIDEVAADAEAANGETMVEANSVDLVDHAATNGSASTNGDHGSPTSTD